MSTPRHRIRSTSHARNRVAGPASGREKTTPSGRRMSRVLVRAEFTSCDGGSELVAPFIAHVADRAGWQRLHLEKKDVVSTVILPTGWQSPRGGYVKPGRGGTGKRGGVSRIPIVPTHECIPLAHAGMARPARCGEPALSASRAGGFSRAPFRGAGGVAARHGVEPRFRGPGHRPGGKSRRPTTRACQQAREQIQEAVQRVHLAKPHPDSTSAKTRGR